MEKAPRFPQFADKDRTRMLAFLTESGSVSSGYLWERIRTEHTKFESDLQALREAQYIKVQIATNGKSRNIEATTLGKLAIKQYTAYLESVGKKSKTDEP